MTYDQINAGSPTTAEQLQALISNMESTHDEECRCDSCDARYQDWLSSGASL